MLLPKSARLLSSTVAPAVPPSMAFLSRDPSTTDDPAIFYRRRPRAFALWRPHDWAVKVEPKLGKTSKLAQAVRYALNQRVYVERCFTDGRFEIDNGEIERVLKKPCVGRRNYLHCGSVDGAKRLAAAYTLVMSCKALGINVNDYLVDVIAKLSNGWKLSRIRELVPDAWAAARSADPPGQ